MNQRSTFSPKLSREYLFEFISIFIAVIAAFALNNWNDDRKDREAEEKILTEIMSGLDKDLADMAMNEGSHREGIIALNYWRKAIMGKEINTDSVAPYHFNLTRDLVSILNVSGYEALKSRGLELVENDSLRNSIISLYEFDYQVLRKLEEEYKEIQFQDSYFETFNRAIAPFIVFNDEGLITGIDKILLSNDIRKELLTILWRIEINRTFILRYYAEVMKSAEELGSEIGKELDI